MLAGPATAPTANVMSTLKQRAIPHGQGEGKASVREQAAGLPRDGGGGGENHEPGTLNLITGAARAGAVAEAQHGGVVSRGGVASRMRRSPLRRRPPPRQARRRCRRRAGRTK